MILFSDVQHFQFECSLAEVSETKWETLAFLEKCWTKVKVVVFKAGNLTYVSVGCKGDLLLLHFCQRVNGDHICWCWIVDNTCTSAAALFRDGQWSSCSPFWSIKIFLYVYKSCPCLKPVLASESPSSIFIPVCLPFTLLLNCYPFSSPAVSFVNGHSSITFEIS